MTLLVLYLFAGMAYAVPTLPLVLREWEWGAADAAMLAAHVVLAWPTYVFEDVLDALSADEE